MTRLAPADLATAFKQRGIDASELTSPKTAAKAILEAGGDKKTAELVRELDDASLAVIRVLLDDPKQSSAPIKGGGVGGAGVNRFKLEGELAKSTRPVAAETARALYKPSVKTPERPLERFLLHAGKLHDELSGPNAAALMTDSKVCEGVRKHLFMLQALVRFYESRGPSKGMEKALDTIKTLEDAMGAFGYASDIAAATKELKLPRDAQWAIEKAVEDARANLKKVVENGWSPDKNGRIENINAIVDTAAKIEFGSVKRDRARVGELLAEMCADVAKKSPALDMNHLEDGVHELRRALRWIPITLIALDGLVALDEKANGPFAELKKQPVAQTPFAKLPAAAGTDAEKIKLAWPLFLALSQAIGDLGKIKDRGQLIEGVGKVLAGMPLSSEEPVPAKFVAQAEQLVGDPGGMQQVHRDAAKIHAGLEKSRLLSHMQHAFEA
jgi:hypothetical protein